MVPHIAAAPEAPRPVCSITAPMLRALPSVCAATDAACQRAPEDHPQGATAGELTPKERLLHELLDAMPYPAGVFDGDRFVIGNSTFVRNYGGARIRAAGVLISELYPDPQLAARVRAENEAVLRTGEELLTEERTFDLADGRTSVYRLRKRRAVLPDGRYGVLVAAEDLTLHRRAEQARLDSEERFRTLIEQAPDAIVVHRNGRFVYANPATATVLGRSVEQIVDRALADVIHPEDLPGVTARVAQMLATGTPAPTVVLRYVTADGGVVLGETSAMPLEWDGAPAVIVFARDVTERTRMEAKLRQAERLASVGTLAAGVAHEVNNPLTFVIGNLSLAAEQLREVAGELAARADARDQRALETLGAIAESVAEAREGAERVRIVVADLRALCRADDGRRTRVDVCAVLEASISMTWTEIRHRARLVRTYESPAPVVDANVSHLGQAFLDLLLNAARAIPVGAAEENEIRVSARTRGGFVVVEIADTGAGLGAEQLARIFDPFAAPRGPGEGTTLGLSVCHGIVTSMGGEIHVESTPGTGATFRVTLPVAAAAASKSGPLAGAGSAGVRPAPIANPGTRSSQQLPAVAASAALFGPPVRTPLPAKNEAGTSRASGSYESGPPGAPGATSWPAPGAGARRRVLVVDDEPAIGRAIGRMIERAGHEVVVVGSANEALARVRAGEDFSLVLCDVMMPEVTGIELHARVTALDPRLAARFVFVTGGAFTAEAQAFLARVPNQRVDKPLGMTQVRALLDGR